jgi:hypothetical protein
LGLTRGSEKHTGSAYFRNIYVSNSFLQASFLVTLKL